MNKKELYELCKNQREQIRFHPMDMKELREENEKLKEENQQLVYDFDSDEKNIHYKNLTEENEKLKKETNSKVNLLCEWGEEDIKMEKLLENELWVPTGTFKNNYEMLEAIFEDYKLLKSKNSKIRKANKDFAEVVKSYEETMKTQKMENNSQSREIDDLKWSQGVHITQKGREIDKLKLENNKLIHKIYKFDPETGEMKGTLIDSYKTINYKQWRHTNLQEQIAYECNDDDSMFDLGYYIKFLETSHMKL
tara:strand:+ start:337 stop:1089 length:753 start_codon:yes stop_codon:yes gene_type:complete